MKQKSKFFIKSIMLFSLVVPLSLQAESSNLQALPAYTISDLGEATLSSVGSDSMTELVDSWVEAYRQHQPKLTVQVTSRGSAMAPSALIEGSANLGPMARPMKQDELEQFRTNFGFEPTRIKTAIAAVAIYTNINNPLNEISLEQLDGIFSKSLYRAENGRLNTWKDLGVSGSFASKPIMAIGSIAHAYAHSYFKQRVLLQGEYAEYVSTVADMSSLAAVLNDNPHAIAYGLYTEKVPAGLKMLAVKRAPEAKAVVASIQNVLDDSYPLGRVLSVYVVQEPGEKIDIASNDFLRFILSRQGQSIVEQEGLVPLPLNVVKTELAKLN